MGRDRGMTRSKTKGQETATRVLVLCSPWKWLRITILQRREIEVRSGKGIVVYFAYIHSRTDMHHSGSSLSLFPFPLFLLFLFFFFSERDLKKTSCGCISKREHTLLTLLSPISFAIQSPFLRGLGEFNEGGEMKNTYKQKQPKESVVDPRWDE
eukprot:gene5793-4143_t